MVVEKLPEVVPPSVRVPGRGLLVLLILEARRRRNRGEIVKKGSVFEGFASQRIYGRRGAARGATRGPGGPTLGRAGRASGALVGPLWPLLGNSQSFRSADFLLYFPKKIWSIFNTGET